MNNAAYNAGINDAMNTIIRYVKIDKVFRDELCNQLLKLRKPFEDVPRAEYKQEEG
jgi:hypothetical protein